MWPFDSKSPKTDKEQLPMSYLHAKFKKKSVNKWQIPLKAVAAFLAFDSKDHETNQEKL